MILTEEAANILGSLADWGTRNYVDREARSALRYVITTLARRQINGDTTVVSGDALNNAITVAVLEWARGEGHEQQARNALESVGLGNYLPPTHSLFDVAFAGTSLRLVLPLLPDGTPHGVLMALSAAMNDATITPVTPESPTTPGASEGHAEASVTAVAPSVSE